MRRTLSRRQEFHSEGAHAMKRKNLGTQGLGTKDSGPKVDRRKFLTGVAVAGAAGTMAPQAANATIAGAAPARLPSVRPPTTQTSAAETSAPQAELTRIGGGAGSAFMADRTKAAGI